MTRSWLSARPVQFPGRQQMALMNDNPWCLPWQPDTCYQPVVTYQDVAAAISSRVATAGSFFVAKNVTLYCMNVSGLTRSLCKHDPH